jgi:DNA-directed RNA polymerase subunit L
MHLKIIQKTDKELRMEFAQEGHTLLNLLKTELLNDKRVILATYDAKFVIMDNPVFRLQTTGVDPLKVMSEAAARISSYCADFAAAYDAAVGK